MTDSRGEAGEKEEPKEWEKPGRSPTLSCLYLFFVPLGLLLLAIYNTAEMVITGRYDDWGNVIAPLVVLMGFPVVFVVVLMVNQKMFRQASEELDRIEAEAREAAGEGEADGEGAQPPDSGR